MEAYTYTPGVHIKPQEVSYGEANFKNFNAREVFIEGKPKGEYHIKINNATKQNIFFALRFFTDRLRECSVDIIDKSNALNLEHQLYVKTTNEMMKDSMMSIFESLDGDFSENMV